MAEIVWNERPHIAVTPQKAEATTTSVDQDGTWISSATCHPLAITPARAQMLLETVPFGTAFSMTVIEIREGRALTSQARGDALHVSLDNSAIHTLSGAKLSGKIFFVTQDLSRRIPVSLRREHFVELMHANSVPPQFIEVFVNNNGVTSSATTYAEDNVTPKAYHIYLKGPTSIYLNFAIYFRYDFQTKNVTMLVFGVHLEKLIRRIESLFPASGNARSDDILNPFALLCALASEFSAVLEDERRQLDFGVREKESKTGISAHMHDESLRARAEDLAKEINSLHVVGSFAMFFERTLRFQVDLFRFFQQQHERMDKFLCFTGENLACSQATRMITDTLSLGLSMAENRVEQVKGLGLRIQRQLDIAESLVSHNNGSINILLAKQSAQIALDTRKDSIAMKTIAGLTMFFLPGTFVATFFSMTFFQIQSPAGATGLSVDGHWWLYPAVTIPLTVVVGIVWHTWLRLKGYDELKLQKIKDSLESDKRLEKT